MKKKFKILLTCPPMANTLSNYSKLVKKNSLDIFAPKINQTLSKKKLLELLPKFDGWIAGDDQISEKIIKDATDKNLKAIVKWGVGIDNFDLKLLKNYNVKFTNIPNVFGSEVSNVAICFMLGFATNLFVIDKEVRKGNWFKPSGIRLKDKTLGIVGFGDIGSNIYSKAKKFTQKIVVWDKYKKNKKNKLIKWPNYLNKCDFVILACSLNKENYKFINKNIIKKMKKGSFLINVARGDLVQENDVIKALKSNKLAGYASDVFNYEPISRTHYFLKSNKCIVGSHNSSNVDIAVKEVSEIAIKKIYKMLNV